MKDSMSPFSSRLARFGLFLAGLGLAVYLLGIRPDLVGLDRTPGVGFVQITVFLAGLTLLTLGAYLFLYATRHRARALSLRVEVGSRLMASGLVAAFASGYADYMGIGSHYDHPLFGPLQQLGVAGGAVVIALGVYLYSRPGHESEEPGSDGAAGG